MLNTVDALTVVVSLGFSFLAMFGGGPDLPLLRLFRLTRIVKMVGAYNRLVKMRERLLRDVMHIDGVKYEDAADKVEEMARYNYGRMGMLPYEVGIQTAITAGWLSIPLVFSYTVAKKFNDVFVTAEPPDVGEERGPKVFKKLLKHVKWLANKRELTTIVLHSFTHLGAVTVALRDGWSRRSWG